MIFLNYKNVYKIKRMKNFNRKTLQSIFTSGVKQCNFTSSQCLGNNTPRKPIVIVLPCCRDISADGLGKRNLCSSLPPVAFGCLEMPYTITVTSHGHHDVKLPTTQSLFNSFIMLTSNKTSMMTGPA